MCIRDREIYRESSSRKRNIKNEEQYREYQIWHVGVQEELDELKQEKRNIKKHIPVSYTHLDVYKRQVFDRGWFLDFFHMYLTFLCLRPCYFPLKIFVRRNQMCIRDRDYHSSSSAAALECVWKIIPKISCKL